MNGSRRSGKQSKIEYQKSKIKKYKPDPMRADIGGLEDKLMGKLYDGEWVDDDYESDEEGRFQRDETDFRDWIRADGSGLRGGR